MKHLTAEMREHAERFDLIPLIKEGTAELTKLFGPEVNFEFDLRYSMESCKRPCCKEYNIPTLWVLVNVPTNMPGWLMGYEKIREFDANWWGPKIMSMENFKEELAFEINYAR